MTTLEQIFDASEDYLDSYLQDVEKKPNKYTLAQKRYMVVYYLHNSHQLAPNEYISNPKFSEVLKNSKTYEEFKNSFIEKISDDDYRELSSDERNEYSPVIKQAQTEYGRIKYHEKLTESEYQNVLNNIRRAKEEKIIQDRNREYEILNNPDVQVTQSEYDNLPKNFKDEYQWVPIYSGPQWDQKIVYKRGENKSRARSKFLSIVTIDPDIVVSQSDFNTLPDDIKKKFKWVEERRGPQRDQSIVYRKYNQKDERSENITKLHDEFNNIMYHKAPEIREKDSVYSYRFMKDDYKIHTIFVNQQMYNRLKNIEDQLKILGSSATWHEQIPLK